MNSSEQMALRLKIERLRLKLTVTGAAELAGISRRAWIDNEKRLLLNAPIISRLEELGFDILFLLTGKPNKEFLLEQQLAAQRIDPRFVSDGQGDDPLGTAD